MSAGRLSLGYGVHLRPGDLSLALLRGRELVDLTTGQPASRYAVEVHVRPAADGDASLWLVVTGGAPTRPKGMKVSQVGRVGWFTRDGVALRVRRVMVGGYRACMRYADQLTDAAVMAHAPVRLYVGGELVMEYSAHAIARTDEGRYDEIGPEGYPMG